MTPQNLIDLPKTFRRWLLALYQSTSDTEEQFATRCKCNKYTLRRIFDDNPPTLRTMSKITNSLVRSLSIIPTSSLAFPPRCDIPPRYYGLGTRVTSKFRKMK